MPRKRHLRADTCYLVSAQCSAGQYFLTPSPELNNLIGGWIARATQKFDVQLFAFVVEKSAWRFVLRAPRGNYGTFLAYLQGHVAKALNRHWNRKGAVWQRGYRCLPLTNREIFDASIALVELMPSIRGHCDEPTQWIGLTSATKDTKVFSMLHLREWNRSGGCKNEHAYTHVHRIELTPHEQFAAPTIPRLIPNSWLKQIDR